METKNQQLKLNRPQLNFVRLLPGLSRGATSVWGRATGKSFIIAWIIRHVAKVAPGYSGFILGSSFKQLLSITLPSTLRALETFGFKRNVDFIIGQKPPKSWELPYEAPVDFSHYITIYTGYKKRAIGFHLLSQDKNAASARGLNLDGGIVDERLLIDNQRYQEEIGNANRGNQEFLSHVPIHHAVFDFTSMPLTNKGNYLLERGNYHEEDRNFDFTEIRNAQIRLQLDFLKNKDVQYRLEVWKELKELNRRLVFYKSKLHHLYSESNVFDNISNVGLRFIEDRYAEMTELMFLIEMLNKRIKKIEGGFYVTFDRERHGYKGNFNYSYLDNLEYDFDRIRSADARADSDCIAELALDIGVDFGAKINFMVVGQYLQSINQINIIKNIYVKHPLIHKDLFRKFVEYYAHHPHKVVNFYYDPQGNKSTGVTYIKPAEECADIMRKAGWTIVMKSRGASYTHHNTKYWFMGNVFKELDPRLPKVRINTVNAKETVISLEQSRIKEQQGQIKKDKSDERKDGLNQAETTHASDAFDNILTGKFSRIMLGLSTSAGDGKIVIR